ncbi:unnamed protein product [Paramecium sonneborni]|uniref:Uncharacterized protein n=1 Tax=Paramecium sonneborni TaxID=65129 RepID=A0A8S1R4X9_9CILI|nr:unnamed protein product [Paramecium sonneborni]
MQNPRLDLQNIQNQFEMIVEELKSQNFFEFYSIAHQIDFYEDTKILTGKTFNVTKDAKFIVTAFKMNQFTAYDFYETFVNFYHTLQLQKWKDLGKIINYESSLIDLNEFSLFLAIDMTLNQKTQVNQVQKGKLCLQSTRDDEGKENATWVEYYFDENNDEQQYKSLLRKCKLINAKGKQYMYFQHKIQ